MGALDVVLEFLLGLAQSFLVNGLVEWLLGLVGLGA
jgi:hypothetical protein